MLEHTCVEDGCGECARLWSEYQAAAHETNNLENKINLAMLAGYSGAVLDLIAPLQEVANRARYARKALIGHIQEVHDRLLDVA